MMDPQASIGRFLIGDFLCNRWDDARKELDPTYVQAFADYVETGCKGEPPLPSHKLPRDWVKLLDTIITIWISDYDQIQQCLDFLNPTKGSEITNRTTGYHLSF